jgi:predicted transcriptional regulator
METESYQGSVSRTEEQASLADTVMGLEETCKNCQPLNPTMCVTSCKIWNLKNELRIFYEKMTKPGFTTKLLNALKNKRRLQIIEIVSKGQYSITRLQQELKKLGYYHSQQTIAEEYVAPLIDSGIAQQDQNRYHATVLGCRLAELMKNFQSFEKVLPFHSECYEERALDVLLNGAKTYEDFEANIPTRSLPRVLNRLQTAGLIETTKEKDYVFYLRTKRDSAKTEFSPTEGRVYENVPLEGVSARKLAEKTVISLRRTYKYLRRLKGKKLVFSKERRKSYSLTSKGTQVGLMLEKIRNLTIEAREAAKQFVENEETRYLQMPDTSYLAQGDKRRE